MLRLLCSCVFVSLFAEVKILSLGNLGTVCYKSDNENLLQIDRHSPSGDLMYMHLYHYDEEGKLFSESLIGDLGRIFYKDGVVTSPFSVEICEYSKRHNLIKYSLDSIFKEYEYDANDRMILEDTNQYQYDFSGNVISFRDNRYVYDQAGNLIQVNSPTKKIDYTYDHYGKRVAKTVDKKTEYYIYQGINEIAILNTFGEVEQLRIPGRSAHKDIFRAIAIETKNGIYAPIHNVQGNIIRLVNIATKEVINIDAVDPYGRDLPDNCPVAWIFSGKHYDFDTNLVYFGSRYYCPELKKWLTQDPLRQSSNLYQFCLDNPFAYTDPDGRWAVTLLSSTLGDDWDVTSPICNPFTLITAAGGVIGYFSIEAYNNWNANSNGDPTPYDEIGDSSNLLPVIPYQSVIPFVNFDWKDIE